MEREELILYIFNSCTPQSSCTVHCTCCLIYKATASYSNTNLLKCNTKFSTVCSRVGSGSGQKKIRIHNTELTAT